MPYSRIQNLDLVRGPVHRMLGVAEVRIQTASGAEPEAVLRVLSMKAIDELRAGIGRAGETPEVTDEESPEQAGEPLVRLSLDDLVALGLVSNRAMVVIGAVLGILWQLDLTGNIDDKLRAFEPALRQAGIGMTAMGVVILGVVLLVVLPALSIGFTIVRFYGFTLVRQGSEFRLRCGLFTEYTSTVMRERVQLISIRQSPLHRLLKRASIRIETAGGVKEGDQAHSALRSPACPRTPPTTTALLPATAPATTGRLPVRVSPHPPPLPP